MVHASRVPGTRVHFNQQMPVVRWQATAISVFKGNFSDSILMSALLETVLWHKTVPPLQARARRFRQSFDRTLFLLLGLEFSCVVKTRDARRHIEKVH